MSDYVERLKATLDNARRVHFALGDPLPPMVLANEADLRAALDELEQLRTDKLNIDAFLMLVLHRYGSMSFSENDVRRAAEWWNAVQTQAEAAAEQQPEDGDRD